MQIAQFHLPNEGLRLGVVEGEVVHDITSEGATDALSLVERACEAGVGLSEVAAEAPKGEAFSLAELMEPSAEDGPRLLMPIHAPEVWGAGITYERTATRYDEGAREESIYTRVYESERPELFFKATASRCVGPGEPIAIRADSEQTSTEPEMAVVIGDAGRIMAVLCCNDVTARDIELENPLYLPQAKVYQGSCALGPALTPVELLPGPHELEVTCTIDRGLAQWTGSTSTGRMKRRVDELVAWLGRDNPVPVGSVLTTGTGIVPPVEWCLQEGDVVSVEISGVGCLSNPVRKLS